MQPPSESSTTQEISNAISATAGKSALGLLTLQNFDELCNPKNHAAAQLIADELSRRTDSILRDCDTAIVVANNCICLILDDLIDMNHVLLAGLKLEKTFDTPYEYNDRTFPMAIHCGFVYLGRVDPSSVDTIEFYTKAESVRALAVKDNVTFKMCTAEDETAVENHWQINQRVKAAMKRHEVSMDYQPKCRLSDGVLVGAEALMRWRDKGVVVAPDFFRTALNDDVLWDLTVYCYRRVLREMVDYDFSIPVAVNIDPIALSHPTFIEFMERETKLWGVAPNRIVFEFADCDELYDPDKSLPVIQALSTFGFKISIVNIGAEPDNLQRLSALPINEIKIDGQLVENIKSQGLNTNLTQSIFDLAKTLQINISAHSIEDGETLRRLHDYGCDFGQGFYLGAPMPVDQFSNLAHLESTAPPQ